MFSLMKHLVLEISARGAVSVRIWQLAETINESRKNQSTRYYGNDKQTQIELSWSCGEKNRKPLDNPSLRSGRPRDTQGTKEDRGRDGGTI